MLMDSSIDHSNIVSLAGGCVDLLAQYSWWSCLEATTNKSYRHQQRVTMYVAPLSNRCSRSLPFAAVPSHQHLQKISLLFFVLLILKKEGIPGKQRASM